MATRDICVIVPTIRDFGCMRYYYANARRHGFDLSRVHTILLTEDFCDKKEMNAMLRDEGVSGDVYNQRDRDEWFKTHGLENYMGLIPRNSHAETSFGLLFLQSNPEYEYGFFVDDDTLPLESHDFFGTHLHNLAYVGPIDVASSDTRWVNVLHQNFERHSLYPRGYPYSAQDESIMIERGRVGDVVCSQGLWINVADLDAIRILADGDLLGQAMTRITVEDYSGNFTVERGCYLTVCSMNLAFRREIIPAFYQLPMDDNPWGIGRFDDIWSGIFLKRACDLLGKQIISGYPLCQHNKAPRSTFRDLAGEAPGLELNEHLWEMVDQVDSETEDYQTLYAKFADMIEFTKTDYVNSAFLPYMAKRMRKWTECVDLLSA